MTGQLGTVGEGDARLDHFRGVLQNDGEELEASGFSQAEAILCDLEKQLERQTILNKVSYRFDGQTPCK